MVPLVPGALAEGSPAPLIGLPVESIVVLLLLCLLPWRPARVVVAVGFGLIIVFGLVLAGIDAGYRSVLDIPFDPLDWQQLGDAFGVVQGSIGGAAASSAGRAPRARRRRVDRRALMGRAARGRGRQARSRRTERS